MHSLPLVWGCPIQGDPLHWGCFCRFLVFWSPLSLHTVMSRSVGGINAINAQNKNKQKNNWSTIGHTCHSAGVQCSCILKSASNYNWQFEQWKMLSSCHLAIQYLKNLLWIAFENYYATAQIYLSKNYHAYSINNTKWKLHHLCMYTAFT